MRKHSAGFAALAVLIVVTSVISCTQETIVFQDREPFNPPPDIQNGFLGYFTPSAKQTTCGNCHVDFQVPWSRTRHADAFNTLASLPSGVAQDFCYNCHTVNSRGNDVASPAGWEVIQDSAYHDVQCESCHGPGLTHLEGVGQGNITDRPFAKISPVGDGTCADCHSGTHHPFAEQWSASKHAIADARQNFGSCAGCHGARGALERWGELADYEEKNTADLLPVATCATCHDPHGDTPFDHQLRLSITDPEPDKHLCMSCHLRRVEPGTNSSRANTPHTAQGAVLLGFAGWRPPGFVYDTARIYGSHATTANPKLCAGCHVSRFEVTDSTAGFLFQSTGHQFEAVPCVDAQGVPTGATDCAFNTTARNWSSCVGSGCHATQGVAANAYTASRIELKLLADIIWTDTDGDLVIDPFPEDRGYLPKVLINAPGDLNPSDSILTAADGSEFNVRMCGVGHYDHEDGSYGGHNKFLCVALLASSASYLQSIYGGFLPAPPASVQAVWDYWAQTVPSGAPGQPLIKRESFPIMR